MKRRMPLCLCALLFTALLACMLLHPPAASTVLEDAPSRQLLRIWSVSSIGGSDSWLKKQLQQFEKQNPGVMTYLRTVPPEALTEENAVLPDLVLYTPGTLTNPQECFSPLSGTQSLREPLLRSGRWRGQQYGLPLCWGAYVLCINGSVDPQSAATPAPTTLLGRPAATPDACATPLPYPYEAVLRSDTPLLAPSGCGVFTLCCLLDPSRRPQLPAGSSTPSEVYTAFRSAQCASAVLTTGQVTAFSALSSAGKGFSWRTMVPTEIITDQVLMASVVKGAEDSAAPRLLSFLTSSAAQQALTSQNLHTALHSTKLYLSGVEGEVESAAARTLTTVNAYVPSADVSQSAWQAYTGQTGLSEALLPLL